MEDICLAIIHYWLATKSVPNEKKEERRNGAIVQNFCLFRRGKRLLCNMPVCMFKSCLNWQSTNSNIIQKYCVSIEFSKTHKKNFDHKTVDVGKERRDKNSMSLSILSRGRNLSFLCSCLLLACLFLLGCLLESLLLFLLLFFELIHFL